MFTTIHRNVFAAVVPLLLFYSKHVVSHPVSKPYIPYRTSPFDQTAMHHALELEEHDPTTSKIHAFGSEVDSTQCPLQFSLGVSKQIHTGTAFVHAIRKPPLLRSIFPARGPGKQVVFTTQYEHVDLLSPAALETPGQAIKEALLQAPDFPLLLESSSFLTSPILHDVNADGTTDVILTDYDGGIYVLGLAGNPQRYFHRAQVPRMYVRRDWFQGRVNETLGIDPSTQKADNDTAKQDPHDPYHSYFEYYYNGDGGNKDILQGVTANLLEQDHDHAKALKERRSQRVKHKNPDANPAENAAAAAEVKMEGDTEKIENHQAHAGEEVILNKGNEGDTDVHRRLQEHVDAQHHEGDHNQQHFDEHQQHHQQAEEGHEHYDSEHVDAHHEQRQIDEHGAVDHHHIDEHGEHYEQHHAEEHGEYHQEQRHTEEHVDVHHDQRQVDEHGEVHQDQKHMDEHVDGHQEHQHEDEHAEMHQEEHGGEEHGEVHHEQNYAGEHGEARQEHRIDEHSEKHQQQHNGHEEHVDAQQETQHHGEEHVSVDHEENHEHDNHPDEHVNEHHEPINAHHGSGEGAAQDHNQIHDGIDAHAVHQMQQAQGEGDHLGEQNIERPHDSARDVNKDRPEAQAQRYLDQNPGEGHDGKEDIRNHGNDPDAMLDDIIQYEDRRDGTFDDLQLPLDDTVPQDPGLVKEEVIKEEERKMPRAVDDYAMDDMAYGERYDGAYDDYYGYNGDHDRYYDTKNYIRIPPHVLCDPVLAEIPKLYGNTDEKEDMLFVAVSYYLDEDEYEGFFNYKRFEAEDGGDDTEVKRGSYVASAIMAYVLGQSTRWVGQTHLDLSTDFTSPENATLVDSIPIQSDTTKMGAFALGRPTVADIDGDGNYEVILGTSMGIIYAFDARQMVKKDKWPVQMKHPIEAPIIVEDVLGDTNLELFVSDIGGDVVCLNSAGERIWNRNLVSSLGKSTSQLIGSSPMTLGDIDGDGQMDIVMTLGFSDKSYVYAISAVTGRDLDHFPVEIDDIVFSDDLSDGILHQKIPQPLLVDLHQDQSHVNDYIRRNGTAWKPKRQASKGRPPHGGFAPGLHIVQPIAHDVYIVEGGSGCGQKIPIGDDLSAMVQVDDVHGTNRLDLVIATETKGIVTLESSSPYHPLNTWSHGPMRGRINAHSHGYSASQGIFVHELSRQFRDIFGVYVPITFEIFDNRPGIKDEPEKRKYKVEIRDGTSSRRTIWRKEFNQPGIYTDNLYISYGPGYYSLSVLMFTSHGLVYEDTFQIGYNVRFLDGFGVLLWLPLVIAAIVILLLRGTRQSNWEEDDFDRDREDSNLGILGRALPT